MQPSGRATRTYPRHFALLTAGVLAGLVAASPVQAAERPERGEEYHRDFVHGAPPDPTEDWAIAWGGRLYDKWWEALEKPEPKETHAAYPATSRTKGAGTWRCKECHGWDYKGAAGAYGSGGRFTGIKGIDGAVGKDPKAIAALLRDKTHGYTPDMIPAEMLDRLALFVAKGQHDSDRYIDAKTRKAKGYADRGRAHYQNICAACHGFDGKSINFGTEKEPEYVGTIGQANPFEMLHKIRNGQPAVPMPAWRSLDMSIAVDVMTYTQGLPAK